MEKHSENTGAIRGIVVTPNARRDLSPETVEALRSAQQILHGAEKGDLCPELESGELRGIVETVVRDLAKGKSVDRIVKTRKISRVLTARICQIYFTHPGIDVQGVMDRIEIAGR